LYICRLFEEHSELLVLFSKFRELRTKEEQATSEELAEHANKVMTTLDEGIRGLDDLDAFFAYLHQVGGSHTRIPGFQAEYFWVSEQKTYYNKMLSVDIFPSLLFILFFCLLNIIF